MCSSHDRSSPRIESQGHTYRSRVIGLGSVAWGGRGDRQRRSPACVDMVTWSVLPRSSIEDSFSSFAIYLLRRTVLSMTSIASLFILLYVEMDTIRGLNSESLIAEVHEY